MTPVIGERYREKLREPLEALGLSPIWLPDNPQIDPRLAGHADLSVFLSGGTVVVAGGIYPYIVNYLTNRGYYVIPTAEQGKKYPDDAGLCVCATGKYTIYNPKTVDPAVRPLVTGIPVTVAQGYAKCAVCVVSPDGIITADPGVGSSASGAGMDVLDIVPGHIALDGFEYGFIGGASFPLDDKHLAFTGTLDGHPDKVRILAFLHKYGVEPVFLTNGPLFDIGGAIPLP